MRDCRSKCFSCSFEHGREDCSLKVHTCGPVPDDFTTRNESFCCHEHFLDDRASLWGCPGRKTTPSKTGSPKNDQKPYFLLPIKRASGKKSNRRRVWHFIERERRPRKRHEQQHIVSPSSRLIHPSSHHPQRSVAILVRARVVPSHSISLGKKLPSLRRG